MGETPGESMRHKMNLEIEHDDVRIETDLHGDGIAIQMFNTESFGTSVMITLTKYEAIKLRDELDNLIKNLS